MLVSLNPVSVRPRVPSACSRRCTTLDASKCPDGKEDA